MMEDLIKLDDLLREFWEGFFKEFPMLDLFGMLIVVAIITIIFMFI
jgi:hypothetical protein